MILAVVALDQSAILGAITWIFKWICQHRRLAAAALTAVLALVALILCWPPPTPPPSRDCPHPVELPILASPDSLEPVRELARGYERWTASNNAENEDCPTVHTFVYAADDVSASLTALAGGWRDTLQSPELTIGPRPAVWIPDSSVDVHGLFALTERLQRPVPVRDVEDLNRSIASSPMVLVTAGRTGGEGSAGTSSEPGEVPWRTLLSRLLETPDARLLMADPETSTPALLAAGIYLRGATSSSPLPLAEARKRQQRLDASGAITGENSAAMLCRVRSQEDAPTQPPGLIISRQLWQRFVAGKPMGPGCAINSEPATAGTIVRPVDTAVLDYPFVDFIWTGKAQREVVAGFREWLSGPDSKDVRREAGLDGRLAGPSPICTVDDHKSCVPDDLAATMDLYEQAKRPGRVLLAVDRSGSMDDEIGREGTTRFAVAARGIAQSLGQMGPRDEFGLWAFPRDASGRGRAELVPLRVGDAEHRQKVTRALRAQRPAGATPLYDTVLSGMTKLAGAAKVGEKRSTALVVLTDGEDTTSGRPLEDVEAEVAKRRKATDVRLFVIAIGEASCEGPNGLRGLTVAGGGVCYETDLSRLPGTTDQLFNLLWRGQ